MAFPTSLTQMIHSITEEGCWVRVMNLQSTWNPARWTSPILCISYCKVSALLRLASAVHTMPPRAVKSLGASFNSLKKKWSRRQKNTSSVKWSRVPHLRWPKSTHLPEIAWRQVMTTRLLSKNMAKRWKTRYTLPWIFFTTSTACTTAQQTSSRALVLVS